MNKQQNPVEIAGNRMNLCEAVAMHKSFKRRVSLHCTIALATSGISHLKNWRELTIDTDIFFQRRTWLRFYHEIVIKYHKPISIRCSELCSYLKLFKKNCPKKMQQNAYLPLEVKSKTE